MLHWLDTTLLLAPTCTAANAMRYTLCCNAHNAPAASMHINRSYTGGCRDQIRKQTSRRGSGASVQPSPVPLHAGAAGPGQRQGRPRLAGGHLRDQEHIRETRECRRAGAPLCVCAHPQRPTLPLPNSPLPPSDPGHYAVAHLDLLHRHRGVRPGDGGECWVVFKSWLGCSTPALPCPSLLGCSLVCPCSSSPAGRGVGL